MKKNAKLAALAILVLAAVAALSVGRERADACRLHLQRAVPFGRDGNGGCRGCAVRAADRAVRSGFHLHSRL